MNDEPERQLTLKHGYSSLSISTAESSLIARGRRDAANLPRPEDPLSEARRLAEAGDTYVQYCLGAAYAHGRARLHRDKRTHEIVLPRDEAEAIKWFRKAAEAGHPFAAFHLGHLLYDTARVPEDYAEAVKWLLKRPWLYEESFGDSEVRLARCYFRGLGVEQDYAEAVQWLLEALHCEVYPDTFDEISRLLAAISALSLRILEPVTVKQWRSDPDELAADFEHDFEYAADGDAYSQFCLSLTYAFGRGVPRDFVEAAKWFRQAAEGGDSDSQFQLGLAYASGRGVPHDCVQVHYWCDLAASASAAAHTIFSIVRDALARNLTGEQIAAAQELRLARKSKLTKQ